ncbi:type I restriction endonuclease subunit R [Parablautia intestinalis]|uniref:Type I restriction enzyme endonuclease subunit n=1 Tax=Parablautia intestinalis TaxID=2320100 RepID=A0A3A9B4Q4_9FIRM|nr:type I restriction endonuclease subunit R [Parablautia intestinalis]RKI93755.1 type I restriction endonuclease subunit R [Parablautia intestinalis]
MGYQSEAQLEEQLIKKLGTLGYEFVKIKDYDELVANFRKELNLFNKDALENRDMSDTEFNRVMVKLTGKTVYQCAKILRDKIVLDRDDGSRIYLEFISKYPENNHYQVTNQVTVVGKYKNRYDVTILCNGLPIVQIELKRAGIDIKEAINQIDRYRIHSYKGLFHFVQIFVVSNAVETRYFANTDSLKILKSLTFYWTNEINERINNLNDFSAVFFNQSRLSRMLNKYMVISDTDQFLMVMRPYQIYATEALVRKALDTNSGGFIFHTTGSGKTLTSWKCAQLLSQEDRIKKIFFLVDRNDLDTKTIDDFNSYEADCVDMTERTDKLVEQVQDRNKKLIITTIQKMTNAIKKPKYQAIMEQYSDEKVIFIFDECHRSQFGKMHSKIKKFFKRGQYFGFTGTPRFKENKSQDSRTTADVFGDCLHQYLIKEAIFDKNVLGFNVEYISTYKGQYDETDETMVEDIDRKEVLESDDRVALVANHIISHHIGKTRIKGNKYTAIFAVSSIPMLVRYYNEFKKIKHIFKIAAVFSYGANDELDRADKHSKDHLESIIDDYNKMFDTNFSMDTYDGYNRDISKRMQIKKIPEIDILIVVNMYLTGFDSRPLNTLYVDKNLEWHTLLQAFSRTNRVEKETKQFGNIVCYRNLKKKTDDALRLFSGGGDISEILLKDYDYYLDKIKQLIAELFKVVSHPEEVDNLQSEEDQAKFVIAFRELSKMLLVLETFVDFSWDHLDDVLTQQEYENFKSRYFTIHDDIKNKRDAEKVSILDDIDFSIEIIQTDKINVAYIMNLLKNMDRKDKKQREKDIKHIYDELDRTDNPELKKKVELIKRFIGDVLVGLPEDASVEEAYVDFEDKERNEEIEAFAKEKDVDADKIKQIISEYEFSHTLTKDMIKEQIPMALPFRERRALIQAIIDFITQNCDKYQ